VQRYKEVFDYTNFFNTKKIGCHPDNRFSKTNYLKTNLLKQIKNFLFLVAKLVSPEQTAKLLSL